MSKMEFKIEKNVPYWKVGAAFQPFYAILDKMQNGESILIYMQNFEHLKNLPRAQARQRFYSCIKYHAERNGYSVGTRVDGWNIRVWKFTEK